MGESGAQGEGRAKGVTVGVICGGYFESLGSRGSRAKQALGLAFVCLGMAGKGGSVPRTVGVKP